MTSLQFLHLFFLAIKETNQLNFDHKYRSTLGKWITTTKKIPIPMQHRHQSRLFWIGLSEFEKLKTGYIIFTHGKQVHCFITQQQRHSLVTKGL